MCTSLDLIQRSMSDYVIHSTAGIIGEVDSMLSRMHNTGCAGASEARVLDNMSTHRTRAISQKWSRCFAMTARRNATNSQMLPCARLAVTRARPAPRNVRRLPLNAELRPPVWQGESLGRVFLILTRKSRSRGAYRTNASPEKEPRLCLRLGHWCVLRPLPAHARSPSGEEVLE